MVFRVASKKTVSKAVPFHLDYFYATKAIGQL